MSVFLLRGDVGHATFPRNPEQVHQPAGTLTEWRFEGKLRKGARGNLVADKDSVVTEEEEGTQPREGVLLVCTKLCRVISRKFGQLTSPRLF
eukprot:COSAG04_NODE_2887_length_3420_cov_2.535682_3_plen_92_part_00